MPLTKSVCGPPVPSFMTAMTPLRVPATNGLKLTPNVHVAPTATLLQVLLVTTNSPLPTTLDTFTALVPMLRTSTVRVALAAPTGVFGSESAPTKESWPLPGGGSMVAPVPLNETVNAPPSASVIVAVPLSAASAFGAYATAYEHEAPAASVAPQLLPLIGKRAALLLAKVTRVAAALPYC